VLLGSLQKPLRTVLELGELRKTVQSVLSVKKNNQERLKSEGSGKVPVKKKEFKLDDDTTVWVRQASGMEKLAISNIQAKVYRDFIKSHGETDKWSDDISQEFSDNMDEEGAGIQAQIDQWLIKCIIPEEGKESFDPNYFTIEELMPILGFVRGDDEEGAVNFLSS